MNCSRSIDILLATYNGQAYLKEQIDSILAQSNQEWRLLIRDDGSDDDTISIIGHYTARYPGRVKRIDDNGCRLGACLNFQCLLENSTADYIMFSDQDDVWVPTKTELTLNRMKATEKAYPDKPVLVHTDLKVVNSRLKTIARSMWQYQGVSPENGSNVNKVMLQNVATGCAMMINKKAKTVSLPIPTEAVMHDWWIAINVAKHGKIVYLPDQLVLHRQHRNNAVGANKKSLFTARKRIMNHYKMIKKYDSKTSFCLFVLKKIENKIAHNVLY